MDIEIEPQHLPSLEGCSNLSELTLDMERSESSALRDAIAILSTLDPGRSSRLGNIVLEVRYVSRWFDKGCPVEEDSEDPVDRKKENWEGLDTALSNLAEASIRMREKRLTFTMVVMDWYGNKKLTSVMRKWLPKLLPRFNGLGLLHVHYVRGSHCRAVDDGRLRQDKPGCLREDFEDNFSEDGLSEDDS